MYLHAKILCVACALSLPACSLRKAAPPPAHPHTASRFEYAQVHMGVQVRLVLYAPDETRALDAARAAFARVAEIDRIASDYRPDSELMRLCAHAGRGPVAVSDDLYALLELSCRVSRASGGAFDITVGPLVSLWREARRTRRLPDPARLADARRLVGWRNIVLDPVRRTAELAVPGMKLDLGGIAKGYAGDCAIAVLRQHGIASALYEAGGDVVLGDAPPGRDGWTIQTMGPTGRNDGPAVTLSRCAISMSGDAEQFVVIDGTRYSHVIDPRTGMALASRVMTVVIAPDGATSDALATTASVLSDAEARQLVKSFPGAGILVRTTMQ